MLLWLIAIFRKQGCCNSEQPIKGLLSNRRMRISIAEMLTNNVGEDPRHNTHKCSGNWMWPLKYKDEDYNLYETCLYMCDTLKMAYLSTVVRIVSMSTRIKDEHIRSPGTIVISGYADCPDINDRVTAVQEAETTLYLSILVLIRTVLEGRHMLKYME